MTSSAPPSNNSECFSEFIGQRVVGVLRDVLGHRPAGNHTLIFEDGRGLTIHANGSYWISSKRDVDGAIAESRRELEHTQKRLAGVLDLAGRG